MHTINRVLDDLTLVKTATNKLECTVVSVLANVILCYRPKDDSYITWKVSIQATNHIGGKKAVLSSGDYDMSWEQGKASIINRARFYS